MKKILLLLVSLITLNGCFSTLPEIPDPDPEGGGGGGFISDYSTTVWEYLPAPGQFIGEIGTGMESITSPEIACEYARQRLNNQAYVSLGGFGGYIIVGFAKDILNTGGNEFSITSNQTSVSSEPGIVWVMKDDNNNDKPDDTWYELKGSQYGKDDYQSNYSVTYYDDPDKKIGADIAWEDSDGNKGVIKYLKEFHSQDSYFPRWLNTTSYTLRGSRLKPNITYNDSKKRWEFPSFDWGYADNYEGAQNLNRTFFSLNNAVDKDGKPVSLSSISWVKIQSAVNFQAGDCGEVSTEICAVKIEN